MAHAEIQRIVIFEIIGSIYFYIKMATTTGRRVAIFF